MDRHHDTIMEKAWEQYGLSFSCGYFIWVITQIGSRAVVLADHDTHRRLVVI